jgi:hypothetical protein
MQESNINIIEHIQFWPANKLVLHFLYKKNKTQI